jgi:hypothetical protein
MNNPVPLKSLKKGDFFTKKSIDSPSDSQVWIRGEYDRSSKKFSCTRASDFCDEQFISGSKLVYTDFTY